MKEEGRDAVSVRDGGKIENMREGRTRWCRSVGGEKVG